MIYAIEKNKNKSLFPGHKTRVLAAVVSIIIGLIVCALKFLAWHLTGSAAIFSDALESIINVVTACFALISVIVSDRPADKMHPYGHGNIEFFSSGAEGALILLASISIFIEGVQSFLRPNELQLMGSGLILIASATCLNLLLGLGLLKVGRKQKSLTLQADGKHVLTDVWTSGGVLVGLLLVHLTGWSFLDGIIACIVAVHILFTGYRLVRLAFGGLMLESDPQLIKELLHIAASSGFNVHRIRAWQTGRRINIDLHLRLAPEISLEKAHHESTVLERLLQEHFPGEHVDAVVHIEPAKK